MKSTHLYIQGNKQYNFLLDLLKEESDLPYYSPLTKIQRIKKIVSGSDENFLVWKCNNKLELYLSKSNQEEEINEKEKEKEHKPVREFTIPNNEQIKDIYSTYQTYLICTQSGKIYSLCNRNEYQEVPIKGFENGDFQLRPVTFFEDNNLTVDSMNTGSFVVYYICNGDKLYANGWNFEGRFGNGKNNYEQRPILIRNKVRRIFGGHYASSLFFTTSDNVLLACGDNDYGKLGIGRRGKVSLPAKVLTTGFETSNILDIKTCSSHSVLITKEGETFSCGDKNPSGLGEETHTFTKIASLKNKKAIQLATGANTSLILTDENELYGWGFLHYNVPNSDTKLWIQPNKIELPEYFTTIDLGKTLRIACGAYSTFLYLGFQNCLIDDFKKLFESKKYCDSKLNFNKLGFEIPIFKILIQSRTKLKSEKIEKTFIQNDFTKKEIYLFLKWIYFEEITSQNILKKIFNSLNLIYPPENTFQNDLKTLSKDEDSKDFKILVKSIVQKEEKYLSITVHKFILLARSGLFREMFNNLNEKEKNINQINDYSGKSFESLQILINYFYTNQFY
ncbi:hypothetical protein M0812_17533 [Anaeramoeba flamelloides]|uniref:BTB domain-containing protein n=1 Tax=Anaeramoeba flamelloides TaxID=1746091 RepID=A0AAV7ZDU8_9EUKA|nr:hypothetical protein M0812_17533 [Anaeramoeba flamelloides]